MSTKKGDWVPFGCLKGTQSLFVADNDRLCKLHMNKIYNIKITIN